MNKKIEKYSKLFRRNDLNEFNNFSVTEVYTVSSIQQQHVSTQ